MRPESARSLVVLAVVGALGWFVGTSLDVRSDLSFVFPEKVSERTRFLTDHLSDPAAQGTFLMAIEGGSVEGRERLSLRFARALAATGSFQHVANGAAGAFPGGFESVFENRYLLGPSWDPDEEFSAAAITKSLKRNFSMLSTSAGQLLSRYMPQDPVGRAKELAEALSPRSQPASEGGVWVSPDGSRALIAAQAGAQAFDLDRQSVLIGKIRQLFQETAGTGGYRLLIAGPPGFAVATRDRIQKDVQILSIVSFLLILLVTWGGFRKPMLLVLLGLPMGIGILAGLAAVQFTFGFVHGITLAFGACLVGIAIDYPLHILAHASKDGNTLRSARAIWPTLALSAATTIAAFVPFILSDFPGLAQIGLFVGSGLVAALFAARFLFPLLSPAVQRFPLSDALVGRLRRSAPRLRWMLVALCATAVIALFLRWDSIRETDLAALSPVPRGMIALDRELRADLGAPDVRYLIAVGGNSVEQVLQREEALRPRLEALKLAGDIAGWRMAADILPSQAEQRRRQSELPEPAVLERRLASAVDGTAYRADAFAPFIADVARMRGAPPVTFDSFAASAAGDLVQPLISAQGSAVTGIVMLSGIGDPELIANATAVGSLPGVLFVDLKQETNRLVDSFLASSIRWLGVSMLAVLIALFVGLRRPLPVARVMGAVLLSLIVTLGLLAALDIPVSVFHILSLILVAGLGMDYGLFFARHADEETVTFRAIILCNVTTASVFFVMAFSSIPVLYGIGLTVATGSFISLIANTAFAKSAG